MRRVPHILCAVVVGIVSLASASSASANCNFGGTKCRGRIAHIWHYTTSTENYVLLYFEGLNTTGLTCDRQVGGQLEGKAVKLDMNTDARRAAYSAVLASYLAGDNIEVRTTTTGQCAVTAVMTPLIP